MMSREEIRAVARRVIEAYRVGQGLEPVSEEQAASDRAKAIPLEVRNRGY